MVKVEEALGAAPDAIRRLAALAVLVVEDADRLAQKLRLSNEEQSRLASMGEGWWAIGPARPQQEARALLYRIGPLRYADRVTLAFARSQAAADDPHWHGLIGLPRRWTAPKFPLRAADFTARGVEKGPRLGEALRRAENAWVGADFPLDPATLKAIADHAV
jgi:poly(A) polymerase